MRSQKLRMVNAIDDYRLISCFRSSHSSSLIVSGLLALGMSLPPAAMAQSAKAQSIKVGEANFTPAVRVDYQSNSNSYLTPANEISATGIAVSPSFEFVADRRLLTLTAGYSGKYATFSEDDLGYDDHLLYASAVGNPATRHRFIANLSIENRHDEFGDDLTIGLGRDGGDLVEEIDTILDLRYTFGAAQANGNLVAGFRYYDRVFQNRTDVTLGRDYSIMAPYGRFSYRLSADARVFTELRLRELGFENKELDRTETVLSLGLRFSETGKTGGEAKLGVTQASYAVPNKDDATFVSANVSLYYQPSGISRFDLSINRALSDVDLLTNSALNSDSIDDDLSLRWTYDWSSFLRTRASVAAETRRRDCPAVGTTTTTAGLEIGLFPRRWIEVGAGLNTGRRSEDSCSGVESLSLDYDRQMFNVFARFTL